MSACVCARACPPAQPLLDGLSSHRVLVVCGDTGCGKSTQVPQMIMASLPGRVVVTQPRRISAISLAERVAYERGEAVGGTVGYHIRLESACGPATRLLFCTTGVLLRQLTTHPMLPGITTIILDEVHERDMYVL